jgi:ACS family tartrate transporter-like MFS transporter
MLIVGRMSDRANERPRHAAAACLVGAAGFVASALTATPLVALACLSIAAFGNYGRNGPFWAMPREFLTGAAAAGGLALINTLGSLGGFVGPWAVGLVRDSTGEFTGGLLLLAGGLFSSGLLTLTLTPVSRSSRRRG